MGRIQVVFKDNSDVTLDVLDDDLELIRSDFEDEEGFTSVMLSIPTYKDELVSINRDNIRMVFFPNEDRDENDLKVVTLHNEDSNSES